MNPVARLAAVREWVRVDPRVALARRFGVDHRALAALRIALGVLLLADLALRSRDLVAFYTDRGVLPRAVLREAYPGLARVSLHTITGTATGQAVLFLGAGVAALAVLVGYRTTLATAVSVLLLASLHARNPVVLNGGDTLLRRVLLWGLFLPLGRTWSVDAVRRSLRGLPSATTVGGNGGPGSGADGAGGTRVATLATAGLLVQVVVVYAANAVFKLRSEAWSQGVALRYVFGLDRLTRWPGDLLAGHPDLLAALEVAWMALLLSSVGLVALVGRSRTALVGAFAGAHLGMAATMHIGLFPLVSVAALLPFLPPGVWARVERAVARPRERIAAGTAGAVGAFAGTRARVVPSGPGVVGVAADRYGPAVAWWRGRLGTAAVVGLFAFVLVWNGATLGYVDAPGGVESTLDPEERRWDMFADPWRADGWYVAPGHTDSGREVDAMHGGAVRWDRPPEVSAMYPTHRWRMYLVDLHRPGNAGLRPALAGYLCRRWNGTHGDGLVRVAIHYLEQPTRLDGPDPVRRIEVGEYRCPVAP